MISRVILVFFGNVKWAQFPGTLGLSLNSGEGGGTEKEEKMKK